MPVVILNTESESDTIILEAKTVNRNYASMVQLIDNHEHRIPWNIFQVQMMD